MALAADAVRGVGAAERDALIDRDIVADLGGLADHDAETMIDEEVPADLRARMDVDRGQETRQVIDEAREEEQPRLEQPVRDAVHTDREQPRIKQERKSVVSGKGWSVRVEVGGCRIIKTKQYK